MRRNLPARVTSSLPAKKSSLPARWVNNRRDDVRSAKERTGKAAHWALRQPGDTVKTFGTGKTAKKAVKGFFGGHGKPKSMGKVRLGRNWDHAKGASKADDALGRADRDFMELI